MALALYEAHAQCRLDVVGGEWKRLAPAPNVGAVPRAQPAKEPHQAPADQVHAEIAAVEAPPLPQQKGCYGGGGGLRALCCSGGKARLRLCWGLAPMHPTAAYAEVGRRVPRIIHPARAEGCVQGLVALREASNDLEVGSRAVLCRRLPVLVLLLRSFALPLGRAFFGPMPLKPQRKHAPSGPTLGVCGRARTPSACGPSVGHNARQTLSARSPGAPAGPIHNGTPPRGGRSPWPRQATFAMHTAAGYLPPFAARPGRA